MDNPTLLGTWPTNTQKSLKSLPVAESFKALSQVRFRWFWSLKSDWCCIPHFKQLPSLIVLHAKVQLHKPIYDGYLLHGEAITQMMVLYQLELWWPFWTAKADPAILMGTVKVCVCGEVGNKHKHIIEDSKSHPQLSDNPLAIAQW